MRDEGDRAKVVEAEIRIYCSRGDRHVINKLITSILLAYIVVDLSGWYSTIPERLISCVGLGLIITAIWTRAEEWGASIIRRANLHCKKSLSTGGDIYGVDRRK